MQPGGFPRRKAAAIGRGDMRDWMAFATAIVLALLTKMLLP
jgi:hypothetical protein